MVTTTGNLQDLTGHRELVGSRLTVICTRRVHLQLILNSTSKCRHLIVTNYSFLVSESRKGGTRRGGGWGGGGETGERTEYLNIP